MVYLILLLRLSSASEPVKFAALKEDFGKKSIVDVPTRPTFRPNKVKLDWAVSAIVPP
jgi:hypothetical protein